MRLARTALAVATILAVSVAVSAQPGRRTPPASGGAQPAPSAPVAGNIRAHVGAEYAARLLRSSDPDDRIRGIQRAAAMGTVEAVALLVQAAEASAAVRADSRALLELARALARFADQERARAALLLVVNAGSPALAGRLPSPSPRTSSDALALEDGDPVARTELARETAAIALARSGGDRALEQLYGIARGGGGGQSAAMVALALHPPREPGFFGTTGGAMSAPVVRLLGQLGDLRALEILHGAARSADVNVRGAALVALAELGDERTIALARAAIGEPDARLRSAAGEALVVLSAPERFKAVAALIADEGTVAIGVRLAQRVHSAEITTLLAPRAVDHPDVEVRAGAIRALGRSPEPAAAAALVRPALLGDPTLGYHAAVALARSPAPNANDLLTDLVGGKHAALGVRAYIVRALARSERSATGDKALAQLAASPDGRQRALGVLGRVALGMDDAEAFLADPDARVRRAAAMGSLAKPSARSSRALLARMVKERDLATRQVLAIGLLGGDPEGHVTTTTLVDRAESGGVDAPLGALALARRADEASERRVGQLLGSKDAVIRAHAARGLANAALADASGRLADAYAYETDAGVRRAIVEALAARTRDTTAPARKNTLELAAQLDPDGPTRAAARRALATVGAATEEALPFPRVPGGGEAAWLRIAPNGTKPTSTAFVAAVLRADGTAVPIAFDDDGFAIVPAMPPGEARLVLAPRLPSYEAPAP